MSVLVPSRMTPGGFVTRFGGIFEHSPWIAEAVLAGGLTDALDHAAGLHAAMCRAMRVAGRDRQLALLRAHPSLAGKLARQGGLTAASSAEQAGAGLDQCTDVEYERFQTLNDAYEARFGFPFIMAVKGAHRVQILDAFERRIGNTPAAEFATALGEVEKIALFRLKDLLP